MRSQSILFTYLYSHQEMVRDLPLEIVQEPWLADIDFSTPEKVNGSYVTDDLRSRDDDVIWRAGLDRTLPA